jgi:hypothetical protein
VIELQPLVRRQRLPPRLDLAAVCKAIEQALAIRLVERVEAGLPEPVTEDGIVPRTARWVRIRL